MGGAKNLAIISVVGRDQKGVVARVSTYLAGCNTNIEDIEQRVMEGLFIMTMRVDVTDLGVSLDEMILGLKRIGEEMLLEVSVRLHSARDRKRFAILVTKEPHCLETLVKDREAGLINGDFAIVLSNHEVLRPLAERHGLTFRSFPSADKAAHEAFLLEELRAARPDLVVLARYMQVLSGDMIRHYPNRIINIHPSLLPYYPGANAYKQAYEEGVRVSGCTAHFVTEQLDQGPVILQDVFHIRVGEDSLDDVKERGKTLEGKVLSQAVQLFLNEQLVVTDKKVLFRPGRLPG